MDIQKSCPQAKACGQLFLAFFEVLRQDKKRRGFQSALFYESDLAFKYKSELLLKDDESDLFFYMRVSLF